MATAWDEFVAVSGLSASDPSSGPYHQRHRIDHYQVRKVTKTCSQFTTDEAAYKLLYLAVCAIELRTTSRGDNKEKKLLQRGSDTQHRTEALNHLAILFPGRLPEAA
jgi:hypothetical protein